MGDDQRSARAIGRSPRALRTSERLGLFLTEAGCERLDRIVEATGMLPAQAVARALAIAETQLVAESPVDMALSRLREQHEQLRDASDKAGDADLAGLIKAVGLLLERVASAAESYPEDTRFVALAFEIAKVLR